MANRIKRKEEEQTCQMRVNESKQPEKPWKLNKSYDFFAQCYKNKFSNTFEHRDERDGL